MPGSTLIELDIPPFLPSRNVSDTLKPVIAFARDFLRRGAQAARRFQLLSKPRHYVLTFDHKQGTSRFWIGREKNHSGADIVLEALREDFPFPQITCKIMGGKG